MATAEATVIRLKVSTRDRIEALKVHHRESLDEVVQRLLDEREAAGKAAHEAHEGAQA